MMSARLRDLAGRCLRAGPHVNASEAHEMAEGLKVALDTLQRLADAAETLAGTDRETNPEGYARDEADFERALGAARGVLA